MRLTIHIFLIVQRCVQARYTKQAILSSFILAQTLMNELIEIGLSN